MLNKKLMCQMKTFSEQNNDHNRWRCVVWCRHILCIWWVMSV